MTFKLDKTQISVGNVNLRKQNHGEEKVLAADVKMTATIPMEALNVLMGDDGFSRAAYREDGSFRFAGMGSFTLTPEPMNMLVTFFVGIDDERREFKDAVLKGFEVTPKRDGVVEVTFTAQVKPHDSQVDFLASLIKESAWVEIGSMQGGLFDAAE